MKKYMLSALMLMGLSANAQTITFDTQDYAKVSVYDNWVNSPFRTGELMGNAAVVANPNTAVDEVFGSAPDDTKNVVAVQRSRFGSNSFGVRIDLKEPFRLTKTNRYIHVMAYMPGKPVGSKVMVMGLGKRVEEAWNWQTGEDEQFWAQTISDVEGKDGWQDLVVSIKGFSYSKEGNPDSGIDIYSLVIVPDVRSAHEDQSDWVAYFDQIVIDESADKRFSTEKYAISFDKGATITRTDRYLSGVGLGAQSVSGIKEHFYNDCTTTTVFSGAPGEKVQPKFSYTGTWMSGYVYVDWGNDGKFTYTINADGTPAAGSDVVSYNAYSPDGSTWLKSDGTKASNGNTIGSGVPTFTIPADQAIGFYRMRYKVDWNSLDPAGNSNSGNLITSNGGAIADVILDVHESEVLVTANQLNGDILAADGSALMQYVAPYGKAFAVKMVPAPGFDHNGMTIRYGYNVTAAEQLDANGNPNWLEVNLPVGESDVYEIPAAYMVGGNIQITGYFKSHNLNDNLQTLIDKAQSAYEGTLLGDNLITENSQFSSPYTEPNEGSLDNLLDGDLQTFWHSAWSNGSVEAGVHYLQVDFPEPVKGNIRLTMGRRDHATSTISDDHLTEAQILAVDDNGEVSEVATIELPFSGQKEYAHADFAVAESTRILRILELATNQQQRGYWHCGEVQMNPLYILSECVDPAVADALRDAIAAARAVETASQADLDALQAALDAFLEAVEQFKQNPSGLLEAAVSQSVPAAIYDLQGRRITTSPKNLYRTGLYIINGQKTMVK